MEVNCGLSSILNSYCVIWDAPLYAKTNVTVVTSENCVLFIAGKITLVKAEVVTDSASWVFAKQVRPSLSVCH